jgi:hypothetical protein
VLSYYLTFSRWPCPAALPDSAKPFYSAPLVAPSILSGLSAAIVTVTVRARLPSQPDVDNQKDHGYKKALFQTPMG